MEPISVVAIGIMLGAIVIAATGRFLAVGSLALANIIVHAMTAFGPSYRLSTPAGARLSPVIHQDLGLHGDMLATGDPLAILNIFTSMFVHGDWMHLIFNMVSLLVFALPFEENIGPRRLLALYFVGGVGGALTQVAFAWGEPMLLMGASAAIFGILGAFAARFPHQVIVVPVPVFLIIFIRARVVLAALVLGTLQVLYVAFWRSAADNTAYEAHLGGLLAGVLAVFLVVGRAYSGPPGATGAARGAGGGSGLRRSRHVHIDIAALRPFAQDRGTKRALEHLGANQDEPELWHIWLDRFFQSAKCPDCDSGVQPEHGGHVVCNLGHRFDVRETVANGA